MASPRYTLNIKPEDLLPDAPPPEMTKQQKRENFWFYYKWPIIIGIFAAALIGSLFWEIVSKVEPDYTIGLITTTGVPIGTTDALEQALTPYFDDRNGDGDVVVSVVEYTIAAGEAAETADPNTQMANMTKLVGDLDLGESMLFLTDDVEFFGTHYVLFSYNDGTAPSEDEVPDPSRTGVRWGDCPLLASLPLDAAENVVGAGDVDYQFFLQDYRLVQRVIAGTKLENDTDAQAYYAACAERFRLLTQQ